MKKKFRESGFSILFYVLAGVMAVYTIYTAVNTVSYAAESFAQYGMTLSENYRDVLTYVLTSVITPLVNTFLLLGIGIIIHFVRKNNPDNYVLIDKAAASADAGAAEEDIVNSEVIVGKIEEKLDEKLEGGPDEIIDEAVDEIIEEGSKENL